MRVEKYRVDLGGGKTLIRYCVNALYFESEVCCGRTCTIFGKCVFDGGLNIPIFFPRPGGGYDKVIYYNWCPSCGLKLDDIPRRRGESDQDYADRIRRTLEERGCDFNCYTWCRQPGFGPEDYVDQQLLVVRDGRVVQDITIPGREAEEAYSGANEYLIEEEAMHVPNFTGQEEMAGTIAFVDDFEDGVIDDRITVTSDSVPLDIVDGKLKFDIAAHGDGIRIDTADLHPMCMMLADMEVGDFSDGNGFGVLLEVDEANSIDVQFYQNSGVVAGCITVKIVQKVNGVEYYIRRKAKDVNLADVKSVQIDWVPSPGAIDRIEIEIMTRDGKMIRQTVRSGLSHNDGATAAYVIRGLDITYDPPISIGAIWYSDVHTDWVPNFSVNLAVTEIEAVAPASVRVGEIVSMAVSARGYASLGMPLREIQIAPSADNTATYAFVNNDAICSEDATDMSILTNMDGVAVVQFQVIEAGQLRFDITTPGAEFTTPVTIQATCAVDWNHDGVIDTMDFFMFVEGFIEGEADFDGDGMVQTNDLFDFLMVFFEPIPCLG